MLTEGISKTLIASRLNLDKSTFYRELKRNSDQRNNAYRSKLPHQKYTLRLANMAKLVKFQGAIQSEVEKLIAKYLSLEQI